MDAYVLVSVLSLMSSCCSVQSAPAGAASAAAAAAPPRRPHVRNKRCSCATFLDKECVYFCHLDIIWVNTPERVVSYGLGNAPRTRRALVDSMATGRPRCQCLRRGDGACASFCGLEPPRRSKTPADSLTRDARTHKRAAAAGGNIRVIGSGSRIEPAPRRRWQQLRASLGSRLLLEKWRLRQRHRARARQGGSTAS